MLSLSSHNRARASEFIFAIKKSGQTLRASQICTKFKLMWLSEFSASMLLVGGLYICTELGLRCGVWDLSLQDADSGCGRGSGTSRPQESAHRGSLAGDVGSVLAARDLVAPWHGSVAGHVDSVLAARDLVTPWHGSLAGHVDSVLAARDLVAPWHGSLAGDVDSVLTACDLVTPWHVGS